MSSRSSNESWLPVGRVLGHRGATGELTVRVGSGDGSDWTSIDEFWIGRGDTAGRAYRVETSRAYNDRLVLKLRGIDDANTAAQLKGADVRAREDQAPELPEETYHAARLIGLRVELEDGVELGSVCEVQPTGGTDLLLVRPKDGSAEDLMIPMAREIMIELDTAKGRIVVRPPDGLLQLNRESG